jgi:uncharacterized surface protein with fasciclin (FAS1) repeats
MKTLSLISKIRFTAIIAVTALLNSSAFAQTNVYDDVIATSANHTTLKAALDQEGLNSVLTDISANYTVFAPDNVAFDDLAAALNTNIAGLLALPNLSDILTYHVLGITVPASGVTNGAIVQPLSASNTLKLTLTSTGDVFINQAQVTTADLSTDNGVVHYINKVLLPFETVVDVAIDNSFTSLTAAVIEAELLPVLTDPLAKYTVFAPDDAAFADLATALNTTVAGLLALPNLADILTYHVLGAEVSSAVTNGLIAQPVSTTNTLKLTATSTGDVFVNQAQVTIPDLTVYNGVVHAIDKVLLPFETVVDVAIDNSFTSLTAAVIEAELLPVLTDPLAKYTVFAPDDAAFADLATALNTTVAGLLALPNLADILTYHVLGAEVPSSAVTNGLIAQPVSTTNTLKLTATSTGDVFVNQAQVTIPDLTVYNGVVHAIDKVVLPFETVVDVAIDNSFTSLTAALIEAELLPVLTDPLAKFTVFAPTDAAFDDLATALNTDLNGLLSLPNLGDILTYHVVGQDLLAADLMDGPLTAVNGADLIINTVGGVFVNGTPVATADVTAYNGVVHIVETVILESAIGMDDISAVEISVYPNPVTEFITIESENDSFRSLSIIDMQGRVVSTFPLTGTKNVIGAEGIASGAYLLLFEGEYGQAMSKIQVVSSK